ncbi:MAG: HEAT repeat domain-containing protein [Deltaproteobacteria bacterium]|nr:HEAT repeat domain-containing protein [Deltaproteobacteria bacterium]
MGEWRPSEQEVGPLLLELARAARARRFYPAAHPTVQGAVKRTSVAWRDTLERRGSFEVRVRPDGFGLPDGTRIETLGCQELAGMLRGWGVSSLYAESGLDLRQVAAIVDLLNGNGGLPLPDLLQAHDVRHLRVTCNGAAPEPESAHVPTAEPVEPDPTPAATPTTATAADSRAPIRDGTLELLRLIAELERCDEAGSYRMVSRRMRGVVDRLFENKDYVDAYRAALVYCRHASEGPGLPLEIRQEARSALRELGSNDGMLRFIVDKACASSALTSVQAVQVLRCMGSAVVAMLLEEIGRSRASERSKVVGILIAMGEEAFPVLVDELQSGDPSRVRRAAMLVGDMQNPRGVECLSGLIHDANTQVSREAARSLLRIGTDRAVLVLVSALSASEQTALVAASCLGASRSRTALRALISVASEPDGHTEAIRLEAIRGLGRIGRSAAVEPLAKLLDPGRRFRQKTPRAIRLASAHALGRIGGADACQALSTNTRRGDSAIREACRAALDDLER